MSWTEDDLRAVLEAASAAQPTPSVSAGRSRIARTQRRRRVPRLAGSGLLAIAVFVGGMRLVTERPDRPHHMELIAVRRPAGGTALMDESWTMRYEREDRAVEVRLTGSGSVDFEANEATGTFTAADPPGGRFERRVKGSAVYMRYPPADRARIGVSTEWVGVDDGAGRRGLVGAQVPALTPRGVLEHVRSADTDFYSSVEEAGIEEVGGRRTTRYRLFADAKHVRRHMIAGGMPAALAALVETTVSAELWVDDERMLRRVVVRNDQVGPGPGLRASVVIVQEVVAYDVPRPAVTAPPSSETTWMSGAELSARFTRVSPLASTGGGVP